jgi:hypothetical protein
MLLVIEIRLNFFINKQQKAINQDINLKVIKTILVGTFSHKVALIGVS